MEEETKGNETAGEKPKKRLKIVEDHHDDCGTDISGLGPKDPSDFLLCEPATLEEDSDEELDHTLTSVVSQYWFKNADSENYPADFLKAQCLTDIDRLLTYLGTIPEGIDVCELCGGEGRVTTIAIKRHCHTGENFDLVTGWDLNDPHQQQGVERYFHKHKPLVVFMGPMCRPFGRLANYNYWHNYEAWLRSYHEAKPHGVFCAKIALLQHNARRYFVVEQPYVFMVIRGESLATSVSET